MTGIAETIAAQPGPLFRLDVPEAGWYMQRNHDGWQVYPSFLYSGEIGPSTTRAIRRWHHETGEFGPVIEGSQLLSAERVDFDAIAVELARNISRAHANMKPGTDVSIAARFVIYNGMQRLLGHLLTNTPTPEASR